MSIDRRKQAAGFGLLFIAVMMLAWGKAGRPKYRLVWSDEFTRDGLPDSTRWQYDSGGQDWGNNEKQFYTIARKENARVENGCLVIEARKETREEEKKEDFVHHEMAYGRVYRAVHLPVEVEGEKAKAELHDGMLEIHLPKVEATVPYKVKVA